MISYVNSSILLPPLHPSIRQDQVSSICMDKLEQNFWKYVVTTCQEKPQEDQVSVTCMDNLEHDMRKYVIVTHQAYAKINSLKAQLDVTRNDNNNDDDNAFELLLN